MLISTLDKVIYYIGTFLQGSTPHKIGWRPAEKVLDDILVYFFLKMSRQGFELGSG
jgi:hypothetical protein